MLGVVVLHEREPPRPCEYIFGKRDEGVVEDSVYSGAFMIPSKMQIPVVPWRLMPAHTWTFTGCLALYKELIYNIFYLGYTHVHVHVHVDTVVLWTIS